MIPTSGLNLPNFDLVPRRETAGGLNFLGIKGLDLKLAPTAPIDERRLVEAFNKNYHLFGGGAYEAMVASSKSADHLVPSLSDMASICKPSVLRFLSTAFTGFIEVQDGYESYNSMSVGAVVKNTRRIIQAEFSRAITRDEPFTLFIEGRFTKDDGTTIPFTIKQQYVISREKGTESWADFVSGC